MFIFVGLYQLTEERKETKEARTYKERKVDGDLSAFCGVKCQPGGGSGRGAGGAFTLAVEVWDRG